MDDDDLAARVRRLEHVNGRLRGRLRVATEHLAATNIEGEALRRAARDLVVVVRKLADTPVEQFFAPFVWADVGYAISEVELVLEGLRRAPSAVDAVVHAARAYREAVDIPWGALPVDEAGNPRRDAVDAYGERGALGAALDRLDGKVPDE